MLRVGQILVAFETGCGKLFKRDNFFLCGPHPSLSSDETVYSTIKYGCGLWIGWVSASSCLIPEFRKPL
jgi:hypothetical protein